MELELDVAAPTRGEHRQLLDQFIATGSRTARIHEPENTRREYRRLWNAARPLPICVQQRGEHIFFTRTDLD